jgi:hypothetical protein
MCGCSETAVLKGPIDTPAGGFITFIEDFEPICVFFAASSEDDIQLALSNGAISAFLRDVKEPIDIEVGHMEVFFGSVCPLIKSKNVSFIIIGQIWIWHFLNIILRCKLASVRQSWENPVPVGLRIIKTCGVTFANNVFVGGFCSQIIEHFLLNGLQFRSLFVI